MIRKGSMKSKGDEFGREVTLFGRTTVNKIKKLKIFIQGLRGVILK
jgi:hypothetical protein